MSTAFLWHNYGKSTIGNRSDIENVPIERLQAFYRKWYQPDNAVLVVAGKVDEAKVLRLIAQKFGPIPRPQRSLDRGNMLFATYTEEPVQDGEREVTLRRVGDVQLAMAAYHVPPGPHPDFAPVQVLSHILGNAPSGRLYKALVETKLATSTVAFSWSLREPGMLLGNATLRKDQSLDSARAVLISTIESAGATAPTSEEVDRAKAALLKNIELLLTNSQFVGLSLTEWAAQGDWRLIFINRDRIEKVTPADVQRVAAAYLKPSNRTVGLFHPTPTPDRAQVASVSEGEVLALTKDYQGNVALAAGEAFDPTPAIIDSRTKRSALPGGMKLAMLPKSTRGSTVNAVVTLRFGDEKSLSGRITPARMVAAMVNRGTKSKTRQQIQDEFDRLKSQVFFGGAGNSIVANISTTRPNLLPTLRLVGEVLKEPTFPANEFETLRQQQLTGIEQNKSEPQFLAFNAMSRKLNPYPRDNPLYTLTLEEQIEALKAVTVEDVRKVYADLVGASFGDVAVVGDFSADSVSAVLRELFGGWRSPKPFARLKRQYFDVPKFVEKIETPDKANAFFYASQNLRLRDDSRDYAALTLGGYMLGGGFLNSRLAARIRGRDGLSYGIGGGFGAQSLDSAGTFSATAIYNPENVVRLEAAFQEEIDKALKEGFSADELAKAKQGWLQQQVQSRSSDAFLAGLFASQALTGRTMTYNAQLEKWVADLTPDAVNSALRSYLDPSRLSIVKAGDFANKPPKMEPIP
jgi:zinc protease